MDLFILEDVYDKYAQMIFGIASRLSRDKNEAEQILIRTFEHLADQKFMRENSHCLCAALVKLTVRTAKEFLKQYDISALKLDNYPLTQLLLLEQREVENYCTENNLSRRDLARTLHLEIRMLRNLSIKDGFAATSIPANLA